MKNNIKKDEIMPKKDAVFGMFWQSNRFR